jgi:hypothetical protein
MDRDILPEVRLTPGAVARWHAFAKQVAQHRDVSSVPDEIGRVEPDGSLTILVHAFGVEYAMRVEPDEWAWDH